MADDNRMTKVPTLSQKFLAELLGTAFLVFVGAGAATATGFYGDKGVVNLLIVAFMIITLTTVKPE